MHVLRTTMHLCVILLLSCSAGKVHADNVQTTFCVSPTGNNAHSGTEAAPFATLERCRQAVRAINKNMTGDIVVLLRGGVYSLNHTLSFGPADSGTNGYNVIYRAAPNETPILSGGRRITGWQADDGGRWKAKTDLDDFRQLYVNGRRAVRARSGGLAGQSDAGRWEFLHDPLRGGELKGAVRLGNEGYRIPSTAMMTWRNIEDVEFCYVGIKPGSWSWSHIRCKVRSVTRDGDSVFVSMLQPFFELARTKNGIQVDLPDYVENAFELLDEPGEWYFDRSAKTVYYIPRPGEVLDQVEAIAPTIERLMDVRGTIEAPVHNLRFEGLTFRHAGWLRPNMIGQCDGQANFTIDADRKDSYVQDGRFRNPNDENLKSPANVVCHAAHAICFDRCVFTQLGGAGLDIECGSQDNAVVGCRFYDISGSAVQIGDVGKDDHHPDDPRKIVKNNSVENCYIHDCAVEYMSGVGVFAGYTEGTRVAHNEICRLPYSAISIGWGWGQEDAGGGAYSQPIRFPTPTPAKNNRIEFNHLHDLLKPMMDGGGVYTLGNQPGTIIRGNHIHNNANEPGGIYLDEGSGFIEVTGNLVYDVTKCMFYNNASQYRHATCKEHDNWFGGWRGDSPESGRLEGDGDVDGASRRRIAEVAGLESAYRDLLENDAVVLRRDFKERSSRFPHDPVAFVAWQESYRQKLAAWLMGGGMPTRVPLNARIIETQEFPKFTLRRVEYRTRQDRTNTLLISLPKDVAEAPLLLALHGHESTWGQAAESAYRMGGADDFCAYYAERGWAVVQPATMNHTLGRKDWTLQGEWTWDAIVALDYAATLTEVDVDRVAVCGLSTGGHLAMSVLALDDRVKAGVIGCQLSTWNHYRTRMQIPPHCDCGISRQLGDKLEQCDWAALAAPKPVQFQHGRQDACYCPGADPKLLNLEWNTAVMPSEEYEMMFAEVKQAYALAGQPENVVTQFHDGGHKVDNVLAFQSLTDAVSTTPKH